MLANENKFDTYCQIPQNLVDKSIEIFNFLKQNKIEFKNKSCDLNAFRTPNILGYNETNELSSELLPYISPSLRELVYPDNHPSRIVYSGRFFENYKSKHLQFKSLHFVEYKKGGYQLSNRNDHLEEFSCRIYLNKSEAQTVLQLSHNSRLKVGPKTGRVFLHTSDLLISEEKDPIGGKLILVGALVSDTFKPRVVVNKPKANLLKKCLNKIYFWKD